MYIAPNSICLKYTKQRLIRLGFQNMDSSHIPKLKIVYKVCSLFFAIKIGQFLKIVANFLQNSLAFEFNPIP